MRLPFNARLVALVLCVAPGVVEAQRQPVVLQHGFFSKEATWDQTAPWLEQNVYVSTHRYTTGWNSPFLVQANGLRNRIAHLPDTTIIIGHSNGGIIARATSKLRPIKGYITLGTPQTGAPMAEAVLNGTAQLLSSALFSAGADAVEAYGRPEFRHHEDWVRHMALAAANGEIWLGYIIANAVEGMSQLDDVGGTVLTDMRPASAVLSNISGLNSFQALAAEKVGLSGRVVIQSVVRAGYFPEWMIWKGLFPAASMELSIATDATIAALIIAYDHYVNYFPYDDWYYPEKQAYAHLWLRAAAYLIGMDMTWCALIGAFNGYACEPADGIVPLSRQKHPDTSVASVLLLGPAHQEQINSQAFRDAAKSALEKTFKVKAPEWTGPVPLSVSVEGSDGTSIGYHTNTAYPMGGTGAYALRWYVSGDGNYYEDTGQTGASYTRHVDVGQMYWIKVVVTSGGAQASASKILGPVCLGNCY